MFFTLAMFNILNNSQENIDIDQTKNVTTNESDKKSGNKDRKNSLAEIKLNAPLYNKKMKTTKSKSIKAIDNYDHEVLQFYDSNVKFYSPDIISEFEDSDETSVDSDCFFTSKDILKPI